MSNEASQAGESEVAATRVAVPTAGRIEDVLARDGVYVSTTVGRSMWPMLRNRRDTIVITPPAGRLSRFDVPLYRRGDDYVLHRVVGLRPGGYRIIGDNCLAYEDVDEGRVIGVLTAFYRGDKPVDMQGVPYRAYVRAWRAIYPLRALLMRARALAARSPLGDVVRAARRARGGAR